MDTKEIEIVTLVAVTTFVILLLLLLVLNLLLTGRNRRLKHQAEVFQMESEYREELAAIKTEIAETTLSDISRDLHDEVGQLLTFAILQIGNVKSRPEAERDAMMEEIHATLKESLDSIRSIARGLSPDFIGKAGLQAALQQLIDRAVARTMVSIKLNWQPELKVLSATAELIAFRIIRECLTNTLRHSGAGNIIIQVTCESNTILITFEDDGKGIQVAPNTQATMGISSMHQYAALIKGTINFEDIKAGGTKMTLTFPDLPTEKI
ncbi:MAG: hypothetical protein JNL49_00690 [Bacteroidia bacterium]|nr:hypothetical protein [Bacteroidia bacterium]